MRTVPLVLTFNAPGAEASKLLVDGLCHEFPVASQQATVRAAGVINVLLVIPSIALRLVARNQLAWLGWDDYLALAAAVLVAGGSAIQVASK